CKLKLGDLYAFKARGEGIRAGLCDNKKLTVRFRSGGETVSKGSHHQDLKKLFQQRGIPPCYRDYVPLIYLDDRLILIADLFVDDDVKATPDQDSWHISWTSSDQVCLGGSG
ncbi:MAG: tRNA lysidine(34) synthetase TilS, partial [Gammaproteobacteria bacterium]